MNTIAEGKQYLKDNWEKGVDCPCCKRLVKLYKYKLNSGSARSLIIMYQLEQEHDDWVHVQQEFAKRGLNANSMNYILLHWWGLIVFKPGNDDPSKRASGYWRITRKGIDFVLGLIQVPSHVFIYNNKKWGVSEEYVTIHDALGKKFDFRELMGEYYQEPKESGQQSLI